MKKIVIVILILLVFTSVTKPSEDSFDNYISSEFKSKKEDDGLTKIVKGFNKIQSNLTTKYDDKIFYSITETTIGNEKQKFLGICGFWFEIQ